MPVKVDNVMELLSLICEEKDMQASIKHSVLGAVVVGAITFVGGLVGGPRGLAFGGAIGGLFGAWVMSGKFKPVSQILMELPPAEQQKLVEEASAIIGNLDWTDTVKLVALVMSNYPIRQKLLALVTSYVIKELHGEICQDD